MMNRYLEDLENRIEPEVEDELLFKWKLFLDGKLTDGIF